MGKGDDYSSSAHTESDSIESFDSSSPADARTEYPDLHQNVVFNQLLLFLYLYSAVTTKAVRILSLALPHASRDL